MVYPLIFITSNALFPNSLSWMQENWDKTHLRKDATDWDIIRLNMSQSML